MRDEERYKRIIDIAPEAIISIDAGQRIVLFNEGAESTFGYKSVEVLGEPLEMLLPGRFRAVHSQHINDFRHEVTDARRMNERGRITGVRKNSEEFPAVASIFKTGAGKDVNFTVILRDITSFERIRIELLEKIRLLESSNQNMRQETLKLARTEELLDELLRQSHSY